MALSLEQYKSWFFRNDKMKDKIMERLDRKRDSSSGISIENGDRVPEHLMFEILSWLPVKTVLPFKSVCKLWYSVIKSPHFTRKHLKNYYDNNDKWRDCLIVQYTEAHVANLSTYELFADDESIELLAFQLIDMPIYDGYMCGPCDGLYFLSGHNVYFPGLWNPVLNECERLPALISKPGLPPYLRPSGKFYGFGCDSKTKDYKVIAIHGYSDTRKGYFDSSISDYFLSVFIYSLKSNCWRYWGDLKHAYYLVRNGSYVFVKGCYYWLGRRESYGSDYVEILSFDITGEAFEYIPLPKIEKKPFDDYELVVYHDSIALVYVPYEEEFFSLWSWNKGVWTRKLNIEVGFQVRGAFSYWRDDILVFRRARGNLVLCDTNTEDIWELGCLQKGHCQNIVAYKESLVSIKEMMSKAHPEKNHGNVEE